MMSWITIILSMAAATTLVLAGVHFRLWLRLRDSWESLLFSIAGASASGIAMLELAAMHAHTPAEYGILLRWAHVPLAALVIALTWFTKTYLRAGRDWLAWLVTTLRGVLLVANFGVSTNATFSEITGLHHLSLLGERLAVPDGTPSPWQLVANLSVLLLIAYTLDAGVTARRQRTRPRPLLLGGIVAYSAVQVAVCSNLMSRGVLPGPFLSLGFLPIVLVMAHELSVDLINARRLARDLEKSQARVQLAAQAANLVLWEWDADGDELWMAAPGWPTMGTAQGASMPLHRFLQAVHSEDRDATREALVRAAAGEGDLQTECRVVTTEGRTRWMALRGAVERDVAGRARILRGASRDITATKQAQTELERHRTELAHAQRVSAIEQLSSALAHELSQPLGAILRNAEAADLLLRRDAPDLAEIRAIVRDILQDDRRAAAVADRMRAMLRRRGLTFEPLAVRSLVEEVGTFLQAEFGERRARLRVELPSDMPDVRGDRVHLQQVILNLLLNGLHAVEGQPEERRELVVRAVQAADGMIELSVSDRGGGIPADDLPRLFDPFFTSKPDGTGLGLAISRTIVELHGGRLWAEDRAEGGATFRFTIKAAAPEAGA